MGGRGASHHFCDLKMIFWLIYRMFALGKVAKVVRTSLNTKIARKLTPDSPTPYTAAVVTALFSPCSHFPLATLLFISHKNQNDTHLKKEFSFLVIYLSNQGVPNTGPDRLSGFSVA